MNDYVFDASAVLAMFHDEPGSDVAFDATERPIMSAVNAAEVASTLADRGITPETARRYLSDLNIHTVPFDLSQAMTAAALRVTTRPSGLSLGDRACLALGQSLQVPVLTADRRWSQIESDIEVRQIR